MGDISQNGEGELLTRMRQWRKVSLDRKPHEEQG